MTDTDPLSLADAIQNDWHLATIPKVTEEELAGALASEINRLIRDNFSWLIHLLYRIDISEDKLRKLLADNKDADAGKVIAWLVIERQKQKIAFKKNRPPGNLDIPEEERW